MNFYTPQVQSFKLVVYHFQIFNLCLPKMGGDMSIYCQEDQRLKKLDLVEVYTSESLAITTDQNG